ncbi:hypothetical protein BaRGS_00018696 [Batillaria attramentaria]|uniref:Calponin-homology (CH) domain-containing protein n=1 Tax=Batillaria attramentaria TaxID=370345 RepID=A0ABD0KSH9_9CAEN
MHANDDEREAGFEDEEEMQVTERELADDAQWKIIQKNTFTRWANEHLKTVNKQIADLEGDFSDGLRLLGLVEVLSGKKFKHVNKRPNFRTQKLENVTMVLKFLEEDEGIRIVNIGKFVYFFLHRFFFASLTCSAESRAAGGGSHSVVA